MTPDPSAPPSGAPASAPADSFHVPFHVGERFDYAAKVDFLSAGSASMVVQDIETVRGHTTYHTVFDVRDGQEHPSVANPLDEGSFIYFLRSIPLEVGKTYEFNRYYHQDRNPVVIKVERREHIMVPAGDFDAIVVRPIIKSRGLFSEGGEAEVWFAADSSCALLRLRFKLSFGTRTLELERAQYASAR
ncbi:MAG: DUF3108 domain-containing protein [Gemmatimonadales bacterium]